MWKIRNHIVIPTKDSSSTGDYTIINFVPMQMKSLIGRDNALMKLRIVKPDRLLGAVQCIHHIDDKEIHQETLWDIGDGESFL